MLKTKLESNSKPTAPLDRQSFTFVAHSDDLTSKRIKDPKARKDIRSHVMKHVRQQEKLEGKKRVPRRKGKPKVVAESTRCEVADPDDRTLILRAPSQSSSSTEELEPGDLLAPGRYGRVRPLRWSAGYPLISPNLQSVPGSWFLDPFSALPGTSELPSMVAHLVFYCKCGSTVVFLSLFPLLQYKLTRAREIRIRAHDLPARNRCRPNLSNGVDGPNFVL